MILFSAKCSQTSLFCWAKPFLVSKHPLFFSIKCSWPRAFLEFALMGTCSHSFCISLFVSVLTSRSWTFRSGLIWSSVRPRPPLASYHSSRRHEILGRSITPSACFFTCKLGMVKVIRLRSEFKQDSGAITWQSTVNNEDYFPWAHGLDGIQILCTGAGAKPNAQNAHCAGMRTWVHTSELMCKKLSTLAHTYNPNTGEEETGDYMSHNCWTPGSLRGSVLENKSDIYWRR